MVLNVVGLTLPFAMAIALGPLPIIAAILVVSGSSARAAGWGFALGWVVGLVALSVATALLLDLLYGTADESPWVNWLRIVLGLLLLWAALRKFRAKRDVDEAVTPKWLGMFDSVTAARATRLGATFAVLNPKHLAFVVGAMSTLSYASATLSELAVSIVVFSLMSGVSVVVITIAAAAGGSGVAAGLEAVKQYMLRHSSIIVAVILALLGASMLGSGIAGVSRL